MPASINNAHLNFRLTSDLKEVIEEAAASLGQSVSDFAVGVLVETARTVIQQHQLTQLTNRDRDVFLDILSDAEAKPNKALKSAAARYKKHLG